MNRYQTLMQRIDKKERILIDGATGTEVERRGVPQLEHAWNGGGALSHPDVVRQVHEDYIRHGAEIVISNTFGNNKHALRDAGLEDQFELFNRTGVELAIEARENLQAPQVLVAGGISNWSWMGNHPTLDELSASIRQQAQIMADAAADLIMLEMMVDIDRMLVTLDAAKACGLPVWVGLSCEPGADGIMRLLNGEKLSNALTELKDQNVPLVSIMHTDVQHIDACLDVAREYWPGPIGVYAHSGKTINSKWTFDDVISPEDYAKAASRWLEKEIQVIGGCCGVRVKHIAALAEIV